MTIGSLANRKEKASGTEKGATEERSWKKRKRRAKGQAGEDYNGEKRSENADIGGNLTFTPRGWSQ